MEEFKYLGVLFSSDGRWERELSRRINLASAVMRELGTMAGNAWLSMEAQVTIYNSLFKSVLTYGHESWILTERIRSRVQAAEMRFLRRIVGVSRIDQIRNSRIREAIAIESLLLQVERSQLQWLGHVLRMPNCRLVKQVFDAVPDGQRPVGRPRTRWIDQMDALLRRAGTNLNDAVAIAGDRLEWQRLVSRLPPRPEWIRRVTIMNE